MAFISQVEGDLTEYFVTDYETIDQYSKTGSIWQLSGMPVVGTQFVPNLTNTWNKLAFSGPIPSGYAAIKTDGTLWCWGSNSYGSLGDGTNVTKSTPVQTVSGGTNWKQVATAYRHTAAIKTDGTLWLWGDNSYGQLGNNDSTITRVSSPIQTVSGGTNWKQVACGNFHTAAIKTDGTLWLWGDNSNTRLGNNDSSIAKVSSPIQIYGGGTDWKQVACGATHTFALKTDGTLWGWGNSQSGQVKGYNTVPYSTPVQTTLGGNNWKQVSCGTYHTAAIKTNGELWIWGENSYYGALGLGVISIVPSQVQTILGGTDWKQVSAGDDRTYAVKTDGTLWAWGSGTGTGFGIGNPTPTKVGTGTNWKQVSSSNGTAIYFYDADNLYPSA